MLTTILTRVANLTAAQRTRLYQAAAAAAAALTTVLVVTGVLTDDAAAAVARFIAAAGSLLTALAPLLALAHITPDQPDAGTGPDDIEAEDDSPSSVTE